MSPPRPPLSGPMKSLLALLLAAACTAAAAPNVLLIYTDDHGWADLGLQGADADIRTPHLDRLAREGVRCSRGYVSAPQCVPSRAGVLTGRHQQKFGVEDNNRGPLPLAELTIAERLKAAGYATGMSGKWHLDLVAGRGTPKAQRASAEFFPHAQGFDEYWRGEMRQYHASHDLQGRALANAPQTVTDARFRVVVQTEAALAFLDRRAAKPEQPWFHYLAWYAPHVPLESPEPWFSQTPAHLPKERRQALAMMAAMDDGLGRIRAKLKAMGQEQDTLIFVIGDNGAPLKTGAWNGSVNAPLVGEKGMLTDGGLRVPFVVAWPGTLPAGQVYEHPVSALDVAATAVAAAGLPPAAELDGVDLLPFLKGDRAGAPHERLFWRWRSQAAVLEFPWKYLQLGSGQRFLFDVSRPEGEKHNLLQVQPELAARLAQALQVWSQELQPPGLPREGNDQDLGFFADHVDPDLKAAAKPARKAAEPGAVQGWLCRNGSLAVSESGLVVTPDPQAKAAPFLTRPGLDLRGPVTLRVRLHTAKGGQLGASWRSSAQQDFVKGQAVEAAVPPGSHGTEVRLELPVQGRLQHLRLKLPSPDAVIQRLELQPAQGAPVVAEFSAPPTSAVLYRNDFTRPLGPEWYWGLGTWTSGNGVLRAFESGKRRHGPVKHLRLAVQDLELSVSFRTLGRAQWASFAFEQEGGHLCNVLFNTRLGQLRVIVHERVDGKLQAKDLLRAPLTVPAEAWHRVQIRLQGPRLSLTCDGQAFAAAHPALAVPKPQLGLGGDSGGPDGEKAGALEFKELLVRKL